jgi:hypothetical protein
VNLDGDRVLAAARMHLGSRLALCVGSDLFRTPRLHWRVPQRMLEMA